MRKKGNGKWFGKCRVCGVEKDLCAAHLLPDGLKMVVEDLKPQGSAMRAVFLGEAKTKPSQTLAYDKKIICAECDRSFGEIDKRFIAIMKVWADLPARRHAFFPRRNAYYCPLPASAEDLFLGIAVSLLRFSYSTDFPNIELGEDKENALLRRIQNAPGAKDDTADFSVKVLGTPWKITEGTDLTRIMQGAPIPLPLEEILLCTFSLFGLTIICKSGSAPWPKELATIDVLKDNWGCIDVPMTHLSVSFTGMVLDDVATNHFQTDAQAFLEM